MVVQKLTNFLFLCGIILLSSCDENRVFDSYKSLEDSVWKIDEAVEFQFQISDSIHKNNLYFTLRNNQNYQFSNLFIISQLNFPNGKKVVDTLEYEMADKRGNFLGKGLSTNKESILFYKENVIFPTKGLYTVIVNQAMRKRGSIEGVNELQGITDVGIRIEKVK